MLKPTDAFKLILVCDFRAPTADEKSMYGEIDLIAETIYYDKAIVVTTNDEFATIFEFDGDDCVEIYCEFKLTGYQK